MPYQISYPASLSWLCRGWLKVSSSPRCNSASLADQTSSHFSPWVGATTPGHTRQDHHKCHVIDQLLSWQLAESANVGGEVHICPSLPNSVAHFSGDFGPSTLVSTRDPPFSGAGELSKTRDWQKKTEGSVSLMRMAKNWTRLFSMSLIVSTRLSDIHSRQK